MKTIRIGNGAGFLGDNLNAPRRLALAGGLDYLTLEYLAELTLSILARNREKNPSTGYAEDFLTVLASLVPVLKAQPQLKIVTNGGGMNPEACARRASQILVDAGLGDTSIGVVTGDDLLPRLAELQAAGCDFTNLDTGLPLRDLQKEIVSANAYLGAQPIAAALGGGAGIVITGRVADASLTVGPAMHEFGGSWTDWNRLAGMSVAGHLIECGAQTTGAFYPHWHEIDLASVGYPIAELSEDGSCVITKPAGTGGRVNRETACEQLVYEIGDPAHYLTPDVDVDFTTVEVEDVGPDRVRVSGATGRAAPEQLKVSLAYRDGYMAGGQLLVYGHDCVAKARECGRIILERLRAAGYDYERSLIECLGAGDGVPGLASSRASDPTEVMLRLSVHDPRREACERFTREFAPLATSGPAGLAGYTAARGAVRPVLAYWPTLVPRDIAKPQADVRAAKDWVA
ncbi:MAG TPA: acyclic terpene utilization AtuA family protein [Pirellulales bacterium]|jgi:hypothetical protein|nr:acyclic terpene utilization AtuA family protein [Pirellulales bacterium]